MGIKEDIQINARNYGLTKDSEAVQDIRQAFATLLDLIRIEYKKFTDMNIGSINDSGLPIANLLQISQELKVLNTFDKNSFKFGYEGKSSNFKLIFYVDYLTNEVKIYSFNASRNALSTLKMIKETFDTHIKELEQVDE